MPRRVHDAPHLGHLLEEAPRTDLADHGHLRDQLDRWRAESRRAHRARKGARRPSPRASATNSNCTTSRRNSSSSRWRCATRACRRRSPSRATRRALFLTTHFSYLAVCSRDLAPTLRVWDSDRDAGPHRRYPGRGDGAQLCPRGGRRRRCRRRVSCAVSRAGADRSPAGRRSRRRGGRVSPVALPMATQVALRHRRSVRRLSKGQLGDLRKRDRRGAGDRRRPRLPVLVRDPRTAADRCTASTNTARSSWPGTAPTSTSSRRRCRTGFPGSPCRGGTGPATRTGCRRPTRGLGSTAKKPPRLLADPAQRPPRPQRETDLAPARDPNWLPNPGAKSTGSSTNPNFFTFQNQLESIHNAVHGWVGGTMGDISVAALRPDLLGTPLHDRPPLVPLAAATPGAGAAAPPSSTRRCRRSR